MCVTCGLCAVVRGKEIKEFKEFRDKVAKVLFFLPYGKEKEAYRKVRHVNLKLVSS